MKFYRYPIAFILILAYFQILDGQNKAFIHFTEEDGLPTGTRVIINLLNQESPTASFSVRHR